MNAPGRPPAGSSSLDAIIDRYQRDLDRTLLREALRMTPADRVRKMVELATAAESLRTAGKKTFGD